MVLHQTRVRDSVIGRWGAYTAAGFLHYYCKNEAMVDESSRGDILDRVVHVCKFLLGVEIDIELAACLFHVPSTVVEPAQSSVRRDQ